VGGKRRDGPVIMPAGAVDHGFDSADAVSGRRGGVARGPRVLGVLAQRYQERTVGVVVGARSASARASFAAR